MSEADETLTIDIVSDVVCPWCYLGEKRLEAALAQEPQPVAVRWRPYQLDPTIPDGGLDRAEYMEKKFGRTARLQTVHDNLIAPRRGSRPSFRFRQDQARAQHARRPPSHPLGALGGRARQRRRPSVQGLFRRGTRHRRPRRAGRHRRECGLEARLVEKLLAEGADIDLVREEIAEAQAIGVTGVPFFIFAGRLGVPGAQDAVGAAAGDGASPASDDGPMNERRPRDAPERWTSRGVVERGDELDRQFHARRQVFARIRERRAEFQCAARLDEAQSTSAVNISAPPASSLAGEKSRL